MATADRVRTGAAIAALAAAAAASAAVAAAAAPVNGSIFGAVVAVEGGTFTVRTAQVPGGKAVVSVGKATIREEQTAKRSELRKGVCVTANGPAAKDGTVTAVRVSLSKPVQGKCTTGFGRRPGTGTRQRPPSGTRPAGDFGFAVGAVTAVEGSTITVHGPRGTSKVLLSKTTRLSKTVEVESSAIRLKECAFVLGTSADKGKTVQAQQISLTPATASGCTRGFGRGRPGG